MLHIYIFCYMNMTPLLEDATCNTVMITKPTSNSRNFRGLTLLLLDESSHSLEVEGV
jgi:hypothetical protein